MNVRIRAATPPDRDLLVTLMTEFYRESSFPCDPVSAGTTFDALLGDPRLGGAWLLEVEGEPAGYFVMTLGLSMEFAGTSAFLDDLFIRPAHRGRGLGGRALATLREACEARGVRVVYLEASRDNVAAQALYARAGFRARDLQLLTLRLATPIHEGG